MLALLKDGKFQREIREKSSLRLDGVYVSQSLDGWSSGEYSLRTIVPEDPTPAGYRLVSREVAVERGIPKYRATFEKIPPVIISHEDVDRERDRRTALGFIFNGVLFQSRPEDRENIIGASQAAGYAIADGAQPGDYLWHGGPSDFVWIASDNSLVRMDAPTMVAFGLAAMAHKQRFIFLARTIKDSDPIPLDYEDDRYWST